MSEDQNQSEVARIKRQIRDEYNAAQRGLTGFAEGTAKHQYITWRMERMGILHDKLEEIVGDKEAARMLAETLKKKEEGPKDV